MPRFLVWIWRAIKGAATPLRYSWGKRGMIASVLSLVVPGGAALIAVLVPAFKVWLLAHWTHWGFMGAATLFVSAFVALIGQEKRLDEMQHVKLRAFEPSAKLYLELRANAGALHRNVLIYGVSVAFRNNRDQATRAFFPTQELFKRGRLGRWKPLAVAAVYPYSFSRAYFRGMPNQSSFWNRDARREIPALEEVIAGFSTMVEGIEPSTLLNEKLMLRIAVDVFGQPPSTLKVILPQIEAPVDAPPPADSPSSAASG
jgi:hypothetical protein